MTQSPLLPRKRIEREEQMKSTHDIKSLTATEQLNAIQDQIGDLKKQLQEAELPKEKWKNMQAIYDFLLSANQKAIDESKEKISDKDKKIETQIEEIARLTGLIQAHKDRLEDIATEHSSLKQSEKSNQKLISTLKNDIESLEKNLKENQDKLKQKNDDDKQLHAEELESINLIAKDQGNKVDQLVKKNSMLVNENNKLKQQVIGFSTKIKTLEEKQKISEQTNIELNNQLNEQQLKNTNTIKILKVSIENAENKNKQNEKEISSGKETINTLNQEIKAYKNAIEKKNAIIETQGENNKNLAQKNEELKNQLRAANSQIANITNQLKRQEKENERANQALEIKNERKLLVLDVKEPSVGHDYPYKSTIIKTLTDDKNFLKTLENFYDAGFEIVWATSTDVNGKDTGIGYKFEKNGISISIEEYHPNYDDPQHYSKKDKVNQITRNISDIQNTYIYVFDAESNQATYQEELLAQLSKLLDDLDLKKVSLFPSEQLETSLQSILTKAGELFGKAVALLSGKLNSDQGNYQDMLTRMETLVSGELDKISLMQISLLLREIGDPANKTRLTPDESKSFRKYKAAAQAAFVLHNRLEKACEVYYQKPDKHQFRETANDAINTANNSELRHHRENYKEILGYVGLVILAVLSIPTLGLAYILPVGAYNYWKYDEFTLYKNSNTDSINKIEKLKKVVAEVSRDKLRMIGS